MHYRDLHNNVEKKFTFDLSAREIQGASQKLNHSKTKSASNLAGFLLWAQADFDYKNHAYLKIHGVLLFLERIDTSESHGSQ